MKLNHIALSVNDSEEIKNFYENILGFSLKRKFLMDASISLKFFGKENEINVCFMEKDEIGFEIFLYPDKERQTFPHLCLEYQNINNLYFNAIKLGYKTEIKINPGRNNTYFIWDKSGNMFELKEIQK
ncbi:MAG: VOC family protein [Prolixibacteraceae bacterium]|nr:VOC family protein [Prolixibacteraceae bacterium]